MFLFKNSFVSILSKMKYGYTKMKWLHIYTNKPQSYKATQSTMFTFKMHVVGVFVIFPFCCTGNYFGQTKAQTTFLPKLAVQTWMGET